LKEKKLEEEKRQASDVIKVNQASHAKQPISELLPKILVIGDSGIGKTSFIQQYLAGHFKRVDVSSTKSPTYY
jgi:putative ribosome biogenesis GTPase RsgA